MTSLLDQEREEDRPEVVERQARALENVTLHRHHRRGQIRKTKEESLCGLSLKNTFGLFALGVLLHGDQKGITAAGMILSVTNFMTVT